MNNLEHIKILNLHLINYKIYIIIYMKGEIEMNYIQEEDIPEILNRINEVLEEIGYVAVGFDNTGTFLNVIIDRE